MQIRPEHRADIECIRRVTLSAFAELPHSDKREADIIDALRSAGALSVSLVAARKMAIVGHVAFSPVLIASSVGSWFGLGPLSVDPQYKRHGIGRALVEAGLDSLRSLGAAGCVVLGNPDYYGRFGFASDPALTYAGRSSPYLQRLVLLGPAPSGEVDYHRAFAP